MDANSHFMIKALSIKDGGMNGALSLKCQEMLELVTWVNGM
jgi:hypothetical protein